MNITWHGNSLFRISVQKDKNESVDIVINPFDKETGIKPAKMKADILLVTEKDLVKNAKEFSGDPFLISSPGEYEVERVFVRGISEKKDRLFYIIEAEDITICYLGGLKDKDFAAEELEEMGSVDILMAPIGGGTTIGSKDAAEIVSQIEPKIFIPMDYHIPGIKEKKENLDDFLKIMGIKNQVETMPKLSIKKKDVPSEGGTKVIVLEYK